MNTELLRQFVTRFKAAIELCNPRELPEGINRFPRRGSCGSATCLLGIYLKEQGIERIRYVEGVRKKEGNDSTHAWLEQDQLIIDVTAGQFAPEVPEDMIITKISDSAFHRSFKQKHSDLRNCFGSEEAQAYNLIWTNLKQLTAAA